ncbi:MAG: asparagine--tRNA ligase [Chitinophagales bacterium]|nr:asparagine--tRNA ligase [Chitinophagales bacterium]
MWIYINQLADFVGQKVTLKGWVANKRDSKGLAFVTMRDGTGFCQCVLAEEKLAASFEATKFLSQESSFIVSGLVVADEKQIGGFEIQADSFELVHESVDYPITPKEHGVDFLLERRHLWLRSKRQWAIMKIRNATIYAIHNFFQKKDFALMDSPIFTGSAAEGTTDLFKTDYFGQEAYLAQTGQLYGEAMAMAHGKIYTFGPTFRAEKSKTRRHLTEFWMIEPEMAFYDLDMDMDLIEDMLRSVVNEVIERCTPELQILERDIEALKSVNQVFPRISYDEAIAILTGKKEVNGKNAISLLESDLSTTKEKIEAIKAEIIEREIIVNDNVSKKGVKNFNRTLVGQLKAELKDLEEDERNIPQWIASAKNFEHGNDLGGSDETVLTRMFGCPIMVYNWPRKIKAFYMKRVEGNMDYVKGVDVLAPEGYGEIVGGSERETDLAFLLEQIHEEGLSQEDYEWYLDLRRFGSVPHSGFGLGLERLITWICKLKHIREAVPFPRTSQRLKP